MSQSSEITIEQVKPVRTIVGKVLKNKMQKTIVVNIETRVKNKKYKKYEVRNTKLHVHDENNECKPGDVVEVKETRPISKTKHWVLVKIID
jgi:small subunit ribosomal protein S17